MKKLSPKEEAVLKIVWELKKAYAKEIREMLPEPKPHINTVSTILKRLFEKGFLKYEEFGGTYRYYATVSKKTYTSKFVKPFLYSFFGNSMKNVVAFFAEEEEVSLQELKEIIKMIESKGK